MRPGNGTAFRENPTFYQQNLKLENIKARRKKKKRGKATEKPAEENG